MLGNRFFSSTSYKNLTDGIICNDDYIFWYNIRFSENTTFKSYFLHFYYFYILKCMEFHEVCYGFGNFCVDFDFFIGCIFSQKSQKFVNMINRWYVYSERQGIFSVKISEMYIHFFPERINIWQKISTN